MKIAIDARIINSSTGRYVERLLHYLEKLDDGNEYLVLVRKKDQGFYRPASERFRVVVAEFDNYSLGEQVGFLLLLIRLQVDLVHFCMPQQPILYWGRKVTTVHDLTLLRTYNSDKKFVVYKLKQLVGRVVFWTIGRTSEKIIVPSKHTGREYARFAGISDDKIVVTYEGSDVGHEKPREYTPMAGKSFLLYVGQQSDYKNVRRLMEAHQLLRRAHGDLLLVLVGWLSGANGEPLVRNREWAESRGYEGVVFTDFLPDEQLSWLYAHCATYVFPSLMEGFGLPGLEAMSAGAPVVSSNATCLPEVYGEGALYFNPMDVNDMVRVIGSVIGSDKVRSELVAKGLAVSKNYSWERMAKQTLDVYKQVLEI